MLDALNHSESERTHLEERLSHVHKLEAIGTLSGGVAHDFNNILMVILGFCDLLEESLARGTPDITEVEEIRKAASRAASLTAQLLAFSRRQRLQFRVLDLNGLLSDMAGMLRRLLGDHVSLALTLDAGLSAIKADFGQLQQVVMNLAVNARDAMPGGGTLTIATKNVTVAPAMPSDPLGLKPGAYVVCTVRDTGVGMDETVRARIFEPFYTTKELGRGTGLGLSVVWGIVKQSDGIINVTSAPGQGTTFEIYLPATHEAASATISRAAVTSFPHGNGTVLVAEDDKAIRHLLVVALGKAGYNAIEAADGEDALRLAEEVGGHNIQLLLSDVVMPRMGGAILAQRLREKYPSMRALFISGNADLMAAGTTLPREVTILQKPFDTRRLVQSVRAALET
jgi:nitrogen-specific signal transduction histidine kinase